jgi:spore germination cell wall hydrolase CwlJ-like protein
LIKLNAKDVDTLARTVFGEARGEHLEGMHAVAWVILNRAKRGPPRFPATISGVCKQKAQFTCWASDDPNSKACAAANDSDPYFVLAVFAASGVLSGQVPDLTNGSDHYHTLGMRPYPAWAGKMTLQAVIGQHRFYKE